MNNIWYSIPGNLGPNWWLMYDWDVGSSWFNIGTNIPLEYWWMVTLEWWLENNLNVLSQFPHPNTDWNYPFIVNYLRGFIKTSLSNAGQNSPANDQSCTCARDERHSFSRCICQNNCWGGLATWSIATFICLTTTQPPTPPPTNGSKFKLIRRSKIRTIHGCFFSFL